MLSGVSDSKTIPNGFKKERKITVHVEKYNGKGSLWFLPLPICYPCLLSNFTNGGHPLLGHPASFLTSKDHILPFFPSIDQKRCALVQLEGMCPPLKQSLRSLPPIHYQEEKSVYYGARIGFGQTFCSDLSFTSSFVTWKHHFPSELRFVFCVCFLPVLGLHGFRGE